MTYTFIPNPFCIKREGYIRRDSSDLCPLALCHYPLAIEIKGAQVLRQGPSGDVLNRRNMQKSRFSKLIPWLFAGPALIAMALFYVYPTIVTIILSFTRGTITTPAKEFVGLDNYRMLLTEDCFFLNFEDGDFSGALVNSIAWLIIFPTAVLLIGLLVAVLSDKVKYEALIKSIMFMPMAISATAAASSSAFYTTRTRISARSTPFSPPSSRVSSRSPG